MADTDKFRERTTTNMRVGRERVKFALGSCDFIQCKTARTG